MLQRHGRPVLLRRLTLQSSGQFKVPGRPEPRKDKSPTQDNAGAFCVQRPGWRHRFFRETFWPFFFLTMGHFLHPLLPLPGITSQINHPLPNPCVRLRCGDMGVGDLNERTSFHDIPASLTQLCFVPRGSRPPPDYVQLTRCASFSRTSIEAPWKRGVLCAVSTALSSAPTYNTSWHRVVAPLYICVGY